MNRMPFLHLKPIGQQLSLFTTFDFSFSLFVDIIHHPASSVFCYCAPSRSIGFIRKLRQTFFSSSSCAFVFVTSLWPPVFTGGIWGWRVEFRRNTLTGNWDKSCADVLCMKEHGLDLKNPPIFQLWDICVQNPPYARQPSPLPPVSPSEPSP